MRQVCPQKLSVIKSSDAWNPLSVILYLYGSPFAWFMIMWSRKGTHIRPLTCNCFPSILSALWLTLVFFTGQTADFTPNISSSTQLQLPEGYLSPLTNQIWPDSGSNDENSDNGLQLAQQPTQCSCHLAVCKTVDVKPTNQLDDTQAGDFELNLMALDGLKLYVV